MKGEFGCFQYDDIRTSVGLIGVGHSMVSGAILEKHAALVSFQRRSKLDESEGRVQFEVFEKSVGHMRNSF